MARVTDIPLLLERLEVQYERRGDKLWASCPHPDHDDSTPSWYILDDPDDEKHGRHHCFGCEEGGYPIHLVQWLTGLGRNDARAWLRDSSARRPARLNAEIEVLPLKRKFHLPSGVVDRKPFDAWPSQAREYVLSRGLDASDVLNWKMTYAVDGRLSGRIVIPIYDAKERLLSYTARTFIGHDRKYLEPGRREGASLSAVFGELHWPAPAERRSVVATEGAFDAVWVHRVTGLPVGGLYGSQLHPGQVGRLSSFETIIVATDPDKAGLKAFEAIRSAFRRWKRVVLARIPKGHDCASLGQESSVLLERAIHSAHGESPDRDRASLSKG